MSVDHALRELADLCGLLPAFHDFHGTERRAGPDTQKALLSANGIDVSDDAAVHASLAALKHQIHDRWFPEEIIVPSGEVSHQNFGLGAEWTLRDDETGRVFAEGAPSDHIALPPLLPGIYELTATASGRTEHVTVLAAPRSLPNVRAVTGRAKHWGINLALYGLRSNRNSGVGDLEDLAAASEVVAGTGASFVGINPLHAMGYRDSEAISPYSPSHRGFCNTSTIALDHIPGLERSAAPRGFAKLQSSTTVQHHAHKSKHKAQLEALYTRFQTRAGRDAQTRLDAFIRKGGVALQAFAEFEALSEVHGPSWHAWPSQPGEASQARVHYHMWLQWVADTQLAAAQNAAVNAGMPFGLYLDLAVGARRDGAESWCESAAIAKGVSVGAPPDHLSPEGQNWNLAGFAPRLLKRQRYRPFLHILQQTMRHAGIIRIDHVLGLNRSFWIPDDGSPGSYIRQPFESLLAVIRIAAARYGCLVVGEDLGLVPDGFRDAMRAPGVYGYSVMQYERDGSGRLSDPATSPTQVLSCFATHDTPTVQGFAQARDIDWWEKLGWVQSEEAEAARSARAADVAQLQDSDDITADIHTRLAGSNADLVAVQLDDILGEPEAQNLPGTIDAHPNWQRKYDVSLEALAQDDRMERTAAIMYDAGRTHRTERSQNDA